MTTAWSTEQHRVAIDTARSILGERARRDHPLAGLTTYRVGGPAALFFEPESIADLERLALARYESGLEVIVIGRGSNLLVADEGFAGIAVSIGRLAGELDILDDVAIDDDAIDLDTGRLDTGDTVIVRAGGAVRLPVVARRTAACGLSGFEWAVGVPGTIGGAIRMNAGGHGSDMSACVVDVELFEFTNSPTRPGRRRRVGLEDLGLEFRRSRLDDSQLVLEARLALRRGDRQRSERMIADIVAWRREHQPGGQNCGSVFVNPVPGEVAAGALIDGLGLRGLRIGTASVSLKHANFIVADDGGSAADVHAVMNAVRERVHAETGYLLRSEVRLLGFGDADARGQR